MTDLRLVLSKRFFVFLLLSSALLRSFFLFIYLPNKPSEFGPDEGTYAALADYVSKSLPVQEFPGFGPDLYNSARTLIVPSSILARIGISQLDSVRLISSIYGFFSLLVFFMCAIATQRLNSTNIKQEGVRLNCKYKFFFALYAFLPSYFLWTNLGLRESASQLFILTTFYLCIKLLHAKGSRHWTLVLITPVTLMLAFGSRAETALLFVICGLTFSLVVVWKIRNYSITFVLLIGFVLGQAFTATPKVEAETVLAAVKLSGTESESPQSVPSTESESPQSVPSTESESPQSVPSTESESLVPSENAKVSIKCQFKNQIIVEKNAKFICIATQQYSVIERNPIEETKIQVLTAQNLEYKRNINRLNASSALPESSCKSNFNGIVQTLFCNMVELPYRLSSFLIRPFPFVDSGSNSQTFAGIENILWLCLIGMAVLRIIRTWKTQENRLVISFLFSFLFFFSAAASLYEGNLGTAFRHKSTILWPLLLITILTKQSRVLHNTYSIASHK